MSELAGLGPRADFSHRCIVAGGAEHYIGKKGHARVHFSAFYSMWPSSHQACAGPVSIIREMTRRVIPRIAITPCMNK
jgi:hypothetical protein